MTFRLPHDSIHFCVLLSLVLLAIALAPAASGETSAQARVDLKLVAKGAEGKMRE